MVDKNKRVMKMTYNLRKKKVLKKNNIIGNIESITSHISPTLQLPKISKQGRLDVGPGLCTSLINQSIIHIHHTNTNDYSYKKEKLLFSYKSNE